MKLYGGMLSPFVVRCVLAARARGMALTVESPEGGLKTDAYLALNPVGKMPCLVDGDFALPESAVIIDYIEDAGSGPSLYPLGAKERARARLVARMADLYLVPELTHLFRARENPEAVPAAKEAIAKALGHIEHFRRDSDVFLVGTTFTVADATLIPLFFFLDAFDSGMKTGALVAAHPRLADWWARAKASPLGSSVLAEQGAALKAFLSPAK